MFESKFNFLLFRCSYPKSLKIQSTGRVEIKITKQQNEVAKHATKG